MTKNILKQNSIEEQLVFKASVEKYKDDNWEATNSLTKFELNQIRWVVVTNNDKEDKDIKTLTSKPLEKTIPKAEKIEDIKDILKKYNSTFNGKYIIKDITSAKEVAKQLEIEETDEKYNQISYLSFRIDANCSGKFDKSEAEKWFDVEIVKTKLHFLFFTLSGSKNDLIFLEMVNKREENIKSNINYDENIDIIYKHKVSSSSEILEYVKIKLEQNGGQDRVEIKNTELFAELFENKKDTKIDTSSHWIDNLAKPYIPKNTNINEAMEKINGSVKHKEYMNKVYNDNKDRFIQELKEGTIRGLEYVEHTCVVSFVMSPPIPHAKIFFAFSSLSSGYLKYKLSGESTITYMSKLAINTAFDVVAGYDFRLLIANEIFVKPYFTYIANTIEEENK